MRWTADILDVTPRYCVKCENPVTNISLSRLLRYDIIVVRCPHCGHPLTRVSEQYVEP